MEVKLLMCDELKAAIKYQGKSEFLTTLTNQLTAIAACLKEVEFDEEINKDAIEQAHEIKIRCA